MAYQDVKDAVLRSKPRAAATVPALFLFTLRYSGGQSGHLLHDTEKFVRGHGHNSRILGPEIYEGLNAELKGKDPQAQLRHMILHFGYSVQEARTLTISDIKKLLSANMAPKVGEAIAMLTQCKDICSQHSVPSDISLKALGFLQVQLIAVLLDKKRVMNFQTLQETAEDCIRSICREAKLNQANPFQQKSSSSGSGPAIKASKDDQAMLPLGGRVFADVNLIRRCHGLHILQGANLAELCAGHIRTVNTSYRSRAIYWRFASNIYIHIHINKQIHK